MLLCMHHMDCTSDLMTKASTISPCSHLGKQMDLLLAQVKALEKHSAFFLHIGTSKRNKENTFSRHLGQVKPFKTQSNVRNSFIGEKKNLL